MVLEDDTLPLRHDRQHRDRGDRSVFVADITIPDGTLVAPGARFTKVWELQNVGTVPWVGRVLRCIDEQLDVRLIDADGTAGIPGIAHVARVAEKLQPDAMEIAVPHTAPGEIVRLSVDFKAPTVPSTCISYWKSFFEDGSLCFPNSVGLSCKVRVISMTSQEIGALA